MVLVGYNDRPFFHSVSFYPHESPDQILRLGEGERDAHDLVTAPLHVFQIKVVLSDSATQIRKDGKKSAFQSSSSTT